MRIRGRRVVLLIAGALPLLAEDDPTARQAVTIGEEPAVSLPQHHRDNDEQRPQKAVKIPILKSHYNNDDDDNDMAASVYDDASLSSLLPLNLLQVEAELNVSEDAGHYFARGTNRFQHQHQQQGLLAFADQKNQVGVDENDAAVTVPKADSETAAAAAAAAATSDNEAQGESNGTNDQENVVVDSEDESAYGPLENNKADGENESETENTSSHEANKSGTAAQTLDVKDGEADSENEEENQHDKLQQLVESDPQPELQQNQTSPEEEAQQQQQQQQQQVDMNEQQQLQQREDEEDASISDRVAVDYASKSAGALVLEKSPNFKGTNNLLNGDRDKYAISPCNEEKKFVVLSLSEDIYVKQVKLANYEMYSSRVKDFQIQISQTMGNWVDLGSYTASPASGVQTIDLREPAWGRYLKFKFLSHYGDEFYCTLSQIMVHGSTMVQGFHEHLQETHDEEQNENDQDNDGDRDRGDMAGSNDDDNELPSTDNSVGSDDTESAKDGATAETASPGSSVDKSDPTAATNNGGNKEGADETTAAPSTDTGKGSGKDSKPDATNNSVSEEQGGCGDSGATDEISADGTSSHPDANDHSASGGQTRANDDTTTATTQNDVDDEGHVRMSSRKDRNASTALPAASIGMSSSNVFSTIIGRLEPLHIKGAHSKLRRFGNPFPSADHLNEMLARATDSTKAITKALKDPAILEHLQLWIETNKMQQDRNRPVSFGLTDIGPREQTLTEKLTAYIQDAESSPIISRAASSDENADALDSESSVHNESDVQAVEEEQQQIVKDKMSKQAETQEDEIRDTQDVKEATEDHQRNSESTKSHGGTDSYENLHGTDLALVDLLDKLPSIECLKGLDFAAFKEKAMATRKGGHGQSGHAAAGHAAEPIFKMLTDQIKTLQSNLAVHDQFTKEAFQCYQRVLLEVIVELQTVRLNHEARLAQLEQDVQETKTVRWIFVIYQLIMGLPNWASLTLATFFTSYISPVAISKPLELLQEFLDNQLSEEEHFVLGWTITCSLILFTVVVTGALCQRVVSAVQGSRRRSREAKEEVNPEETDVAICELNVEDSNGGVIARAPSNDGPGFDDLDYLQSTEELKSFDAVPRNPEIAELLQSTYTPAQEIAAAIPNNSDRNDEISQTHGHPLKDSGMRTPDPCAEDEGIAVSSAHEARKAPPSPSSVATLSACGETNDKDNHKIETEPETRNSSPIPNSCDEHTVLESNLKRCPSDKMQESVNKTECSLRRSSSTSEIEHISPGCAGAECIEHRPSISVHSY